MSAPAPGAGRPAGRGLRGTRGLPDLPPRLVRSTVRRALAEDVGRRDVTTAALTRAGDRVRGEISAQAHGIVAGLPLAREVFRQLDPRVRVSFRCRDGRRVQPGQPLLRLAGPAAPILTGERTALNFLGLLSGIATLTDRFVRAVRGGPAEIFDTRKTPPGLRRLAKYAVACGGGRNHRLGLYDAVLIKDNHIRLAGSLTAAVARVRARTRRLPVTAEAETLAQVREALAAGVEIILLDNFTPRRLRRAVRLIGCRAQIEISGSLDVAGAARAARLRVDRISVGALTHSAPWLPLHLELE